MIDDSGLKDKLEYFKRRYDRFIDGYENEFEKKFYESYDFISSMNPSSIDSEVRSSNSLFFTVNKKESMFHLEVFYDGNLIEGICSVYRKGHMIYRGSGTLGEVFSDIRSKVK